MLAALFLVFWGLRLYAPTFFVPGSAVFGLAFTLVGVLVMVAAGLSLPPRWLRHLDAILLVATVIAILLWTRSAVFGSPAYGTDEVAFDQGAAELLASGRNPYGADLSNFLDVYQVLPSGTTNTLDGGFVHLLSYPAGAFLPYVPAVLLGVQSQSAIYVDSLFWILATIVLWLALPASLRPFAPLLAGFSVFVDYVAGGVTDSLMVPFLIGALWRWDHFGDADERSAARWVGPVALGIACTVKQSAWFLVPFMFVAMVIESRRRGLGWRNPVRYALMTAVAFLVPNFPFLVWDPYAWLSGVLLPFVTPLVPFGQGVVALTTYFGVGGGDLGLFTLAGGLMLLAMILALVTAYPRLKGMIPALPLIALLLPTRSLNSYFVYAVPGLIVSLASVGNTNWQANIVPLRFRRASGVAGMALVVVSVVLLAGALTSSAPLAITPVSQHTTGQLQQVDVLTVDVRNRTSRTINPHFAVALGPYLSSYWIVDQGPASLDPGQVARYVLWAPNTASMPGINQDSVLYATTAGPSTLSSAPLFAAVNEGTRITPQAVNQAVVSPSAVVFTVQLVDRLNAPIRRAGVAINLGQVLYAAEGLFPGETSINGKPEGQSPVTAYTDDNGQATFAVKAVQLQPFEVFYQAWLPVTYPHGYSSLVSVHFIAK